MSQMVTNIINEDETGYILKEKLEARLHLIFRYPIKVEHINGRYRFVAPRKVAPVRLDGDDLASDLLTMGALPPAQDELADLRE